MTYTLQNAFGITESVIDDSGGLKKFYSIANILSSEFKIDFTEKHDEFDSVEWKFKYKKYCLKLHFNIYHGISISSDSSNDDNVISELATQLKTTTEVR